MKMPGKKPVKVPVILQMEALECGAASLAMVLAYYHKWVPLPELRVECGVSRDGSNALNIAKAGKKYGLSYKAYRYRTDDLKKKITFPAILFWNLRHFVVLTGFMGNYAYLNDPGEGRVRIPMEEFTRCYSGICLTFQKGEGFEESGHRPDSLSFLKKGLHGNRRAFALVMITGALAMLAGTVVPVFSRTFTDYILSGDTPLWYEGFLLLFAAVIVFQLAASVINTVYIIRAAGKLAVTANASFIEHIFRLPMVFFSQRMSGDLAQRAASNDTVAATLVRRMAPVLMNLVLVIFFLVVMIRYSIPLTIVGVLTAACNLIMAGIISNKRNEMSRTQMRDFGMLQAATVSGIDMVESIKASGAEGGFFERWSGYHASMTRSKVRFDGVNRFLGTLPSLLTQLSSIIILLISFWSIMRGRLTAGMFLAFQACMNSFLSPVNELIAAGQSIHEMRSSIERISDVMEYSEDTGAKEECTPEELEGAKKLSGTIEMKHVTFGYSRLGDPVLKDFSLTVTPGKRIALVGGSGSGKSTVAKLLSGLYKPWSGEILYDGKPLQQIPKPVFNASLAMVDQDVVLFQDTVANNIRMWDQTIEDFDLILAARDAGIHDDILSLRGGYEHMMEENGYDLSGGQRQRIEIARTLAGDPSVIIMDEATSALDARTEYEISGFIRDRGITCIIIAHRLSTIRDCDEIIVLDKGEAVQRGTHEQLMEEDGLYRALVTTQ